MDGLLIDSETVCERIYCETAPKYGITVDHDIFTLIVGTAHKRATEIFAELYPNFDYEKLRTDVRNQMQTAFAKGEIPLKKGAKEILEFLKSTGRKAALATSTRKAIAEKMMTEMGLMPLFSAAVYGDEVENAKPNPEIFLRAMSALGGTSENTVVLEDSHNGIRAANAANIPAIMVPDILKPIDGLVTLEIFDDLCQVKAYIESGSLNR